MLKNTTKACLSFILITAVSVLFMFLIKKIDTPIISRIIMILFSIVILILFFLSGFTADAKIKKRKALKSYNLIIFIGVVVFVVSLVLSKFYIKSDFYLEKYFIFNIINQAMYLVLKSFFIPVNAITSFIAFLVTKLLYSIGLSVKYSLRK